MPYEVALFDLDSTLFDSALSEKLALKASLECYSISLTDEVLNQYKIINTQLWLDFEQGTIALDQLRVKRFSRLCQKLNLAIPPHVLADLYEGNLGISGKTELSCSMYAIPTDFNFSAGDKFVISLPSISI